MTKFLATDYLLKILANLLMAEVLIGLGIAFFAVVLLVLYSFWRGFHD